MNKLMIKIYRIIRKNKNELFHVHGSTFKRWYSRSLEVYCDHNWIKICMKKTQDQKYFV
jgi:hypothetical protein